MAEPATISDTAGELESHVKQNILQARLEAHEAKQLRMRKNVQNRDAYHNLQDWTHKIEGQSREFLPKVSETVEQFAAFVHRALIQFGDWFSIESSKAPLSEESIRNLLRLHLENLPDGPIDSIPFSTKLSDGIKVALLESMMIFKVHGYPQEHLQWVEEGEKLVQKKFPRWRLQIDLIPPEDYYPDPSGNNLYEIHEVERDIHQVQEMAKAGIYDKAVVAKIEEDFSREESDAREDSREHTGDSTKPAFRRKVVITEFWGTLLKPDGSIWRKRALCALANHKYLIRKPQDFPYWHGESPFVKIPLLRTPFSVWHKALYDQVVPLNLACNELFNLMLDGGIASVWGVKQLRMDLLEDPTQVAGGIPQGKTLALNEGAPLDAKVLEQVTTGQVPPDALEMFNLLDREFNASALTNDIKMGLLPPRQVKATEVVEITQSQAVVLDALVSNIERQLEKLLRKSFLTMLQNIDQILLLDLLDSMTPDEALTFTVMTPQQRFAAFANHSRFRVYGLSATLNRARDFQRIMAIMQVASANPLLMGAFWNEVDPRKLLNRVWKMVNMNPADFARDQTEEGQAKAQADMSLLQQMMGIQAPQGGQNAQGTQSTEIPGEPGMQSEMNQQVEPTDGL